ncbi:MAG: alpha/beta hydrolase [Methanoregula sp.]|nr:alpha/beta hydrolase [Methanoregula sp.]
MRPVRQWGPGPYPVAVIHGGPGAPGEVAHVARELSQIKCVIEPFQTETSLEGQIQELRAVLTDHGKVPVTLIGFSWGAFLSWIVAARYPALVSKLILVSSAPFEERYAVSVTKTRLDRLKPKDRAEAQALLAQIDDPTTPDKNVLLGKLGCVLAIADAFDPISLENESFHCQYDIFKNVWDEAAELRRSQVLLRMAHSITCPVVAIHGDYDPHPAEGVNDPLTRELPDFKFILLKKCGHRPWIERYANEEFFETLAKEI